MNEFDLITRYFKQPAQKWIEKNQHKTSQLLHGIGDDCAVFQPNSQMNWVVSSDMLVENRHFFSDVSPFSLGHKALAVNLSDLAACGAEPLGFTLALALPEINVNWLAQFSQGLLGLAHQHNCPLVGGDTTKGPLNICITVWGQVPQQQTMLRSGAKVGDVLYVSGTLGDARWGLALHNQNELNINNPHHAHAKNRLELPIPRLDLGIALRGTASSGLDLSDGLLGDLQHLLHASQVGACLDLAKIQNLMASPLENGLALLEQQKHILCGGDDYELLFTAPADDISTAAVLHASKTTQTPVTAIGIITPKQDYGSNVRWRNSTSVLPFAEIDVAHFAGFQSFDHFSLA